MDVAAAAGATVLPFCPFIRLYIKRHPAYLELELVPTDRRAEFQLPAGSD